ncbi:S41 family peptidase [Patescibacteria group bacterium]|nr:S41 family peptidase [Patescibacteria group bacterium]
MSPLQKKIQKTIVIAVIALVLGGGVFYGGYAVGVQRTAQATATLIVNGGAPADIKDADVSVLWDTIALLKQKYYDIKNISDQDLIYGAAAGATQAVGDPYTVFFSPQDAQSFSDNLNGDFGGIGAEIGTQKGQLVIIAPLKGTPADAAGLKSGDAIMAVNGSSTAGMTADEAVNLIRGEIGTTVKLSVFRSGWAAPKDFNITRENITVPTLDWKMMPDHIAYFDLYTFNANAANLFYNDALSALMQGAKGVVLDLRDDPGGYLDVAQQIAGWFLPRGSVVVRERMRDGSETVLRSNGNQALAGLPVVVLVNGGSASASEILSGALRDDRGAKLVGTQTFGKGSVQELENLPDGSELKVSVAEWLTPDGYTINHVGLKPDYTVQYTEADAQANKDPQLDKALQILQSEMK